MSLGSPDSRADAVHRGTIGYLSGAPRVSTDPRASASGPRAHVLGVIEAMERQGWRVERYIAGDLLPRFAGRGADGVVSHRGRVARLSADLLRVTAGRITPIHAGVRLGTNLDLVYERFASMQGIGRRFQSYGVPWVLETNGPFFYEAEVERESMALTRIARRLELRAYQNCDVLVCVSDPLKAILTEELEVDPDKVLVVPNGVDPVRFDPTEVTPRRSSPNLTVGFTGSVLAWQGLDLLLEAIAEIRGRGVVMDVAILGRGPDLSRLQALADELGIRDSVRFAGQVPWESVPQYLAGFDVGYSGQRSMELGSMYHSPLKLYEYLAMGVPVLASRHDDAEALVGDDEHGFLFRSGDRDDLVRCLMEIHSRRHTLPGMGRLGRDLVLAEHTWDARVGAMLEQVFATLRRQRSKGGLDDG